jgi:hypothetical protein
VSAASEMAFQTQTVHMSGRDLYHDGVRRGDTELDPVTIPTQKIGLDK